MASLLIIRKPFKVNRVFLKTILALGLFGSFHCRSFDWPDEDPGSGGKPAGPGPFSVTTTSPADGAAPVAINTPVVFNFSEAVNTATLTYNATAGACGTNAVQVSADNFITCVGLTAPVWNGPATSLTMTLTTALAFSTVYKLRVNTTLLSAGAQALASTFITPTGFTTSAVAPLTVNLSTPSDGQTGVPLSTTIIVDFSAQMNTGTVTFNPASGACTGSLQLSADGFSGCAGFSSSAWNGGFTQLTLTLNGTLSPGAQYRLKVTTAAVGTAGNILASDYISPTGFGATMAAPLALQALASDSRNMLVWQGTAGATSYNIYFSTSPGVTVGTGTLLAGVSAPYTHSGLTNGATYYYIIAGVNGANVGQASSQVAATPVAFKTIFVTSATYSGNMSGISGADGNCAGLASAASLTGQYKAYLSDATDDAVCHVLGLSGKLAGNCGMPVAPDFSQLGPYQNRNGQVVAANMQALIANSLANPVGFTESGAAASGAMPFTGTENGGFSSGNTCSDWANALIGSAMVGSASATGAGWSASGPQVCAVGGITPVPRELYCFEQ